MEHITEWDKKNLIAAICGCQNRSGRHEANKEINELARSIDPELADFYIENAGWTKLKGDYAQTVV